MNLSPEVLLGIFTIFSNMVLLYITSKSRAEMAELKVFMYQQFVTKESLRAMLKQNHNGNIDFNGALHDS